MTLAAATVVFFFSFFFFPSFTFVSKLFIFPRGRARRRWRKILQWLWCNIRSLFLPREIALIWETASRRRRPGANYSAIQKEGWLGHKGTKTEKRERRKHECRRRNFSPLPGVENWPLKEMRWRNKPTCILQKRGPKKYIPKNDGAMRDGIRFFPSPYI